jgi:hypothetical protein
VYVRELSPKKQQQSLEKPGDPSFGDVEVSRGGGYSFKAPFTMKND